MNGKAANWTIGFWGLSFGAMVLALYMALVYAPKEAQMGHVQRIFYFHVPSAWVGLLAFGVVFVASILYLWKWENRWDHLAHSAAEIGVLFTTLVLLTGPIWGRFAWGMWWVWDARLTTALVLWIIYVAYLMVRSYAEGSQGARFAAVLGIVGFVDVPIVFMSIRWWRTQHPSAVILGGGDSGLDPSMTVALVVSLVAFTLLFIHLISLRTALRSMEHRLRELQTSKLD